MAIGRIIIFKPAQTATTDVKSLVNNLNDILEAFADFLEQELDFSKLWPFVNA